MPPVVKNENPLFPVMPDGNSDIPPQLLYIGVKLFRKVPPFPYCPVDSNIDTKSQKLMQNILIRRIVLSKEIDV
jgi:hypothetical protein